jgi:hypothetical protein
MRHLIAIAAASTLLASTAFADAPGALPAGKPAGVHTAQMDDNTVWYIVGLGAIAAGIALVASGSNNGNGVSGSTGSTGGIGGSGSSGGGAGGGQIATTTSSR